VAGEVWVAAEWHPRATDPTQKRKTPPFGGSRASDRDMPQQRNGGLAQSALGYGVTVTNWRLYMADHQHIDGGGNQNAE